MSASSSKIESATIKVEIAPGELIDKITILEIKTRRMSDPAKLANVKTELGILAATRDAAILPSPAMERLTRELTRVNEALWDIEDHIRDCERDKDFGQRFIELARAVYHTNDERARLKRQVNELLGSRIVEEKSYAAY
jgi:hypothetical protein